jgi:hypothetical protein
VRKPPFSRASRAACCNMSVVPALESATHGIDVLEAVCTPAKEKLEP